MNNNNELLSTTYDYKTGRQELIDKFSSVRNFSLELTRPLVTEDFVVQTMPDISPTKWHLAHVTWFFESFVLKEADKNYQELNPLYNFIFNSYYVQVGEGIRALTAGILPAQL